MLTTKEAIIKALESADTAFVTYGYSDLGTPVALADALADFRNMDPEVIGTGEIYECDDAGEVCNTLISFSIPFEHEEE